MLDILFTRYLTKKGKLAYIFGQIAIDILILLYIIGIKDMSLRQAQPVMITSFIAVVFIWGGICLAFFKDKSAEQK